jgi:hypothetical protein
MRRSLSLSLVAGLLAALVLVGAVYPWGDPAHASPQSSGAPAATTAPDDGTKASSECEQVALSEEQAHRAVWNLPEVSAAAEELRSRGVRPFTITASEPEPGAPAGTEGAGYVIYFGEDHGTHTAHVATYLVDPKTGGVTAVPR